MAIGAAEEFVHAGCSAGMGRPIAAATGKTETAVGTGASVSSADASRRNKSTVVPSPEAVVASMGEFASTNPAAWAAESRTIVGLQRTLGREADKGAWRSLRKRARIIGTRGSEPKVP